MRLRRIGSNGSVTPFCRSMDSECTILWCWASWDSWWRQPKLTPLQATTWFGSMGPSRIQLKNSSFKKMRLVVFSEITKLTGWFRWEKDCPSIPLRWDSKTRVEPMQTSQQSNGFLFGLIGWAVNRQLHQLSTIFLKISWGIPSITEIWTPMRLFFFWCSKDTVIFSIEESSRSRAISHYPFQLLKILTL